MNSYSLYQTKLDNLLQTKYSRNGCYLKYIYNGYTNKKFNTTESEFFRLLFINTKTQEVVMQENLNLNKELIKQFLSLSDEELKCLQDDVSELIEISKKMDNNDDNTSPERMLYMFLSIF